MLFTKYIDRNNLFFLEGFGEVDLLKIWKGLFYCMWMSDKPLIQVFP